MSLRRHSKGFSRGSSKFRGVTRHQKARAHSQAEQIITADNMCYESKTLFMKPLQTLEPHGR
jgi:hypothetical protein